ncbi:MAG: hypothetical protein F6K31_23440 [Symploca sp. SIO2G7]|nr:hypothetical protein [Symploca sp. SIO2G7]
MVTIWLHRSKLEVKINLMTTKNLVEGEQNGVSDLTPEEYRAYCKKVKQYQMRNGRKRRSKPLLKPIGEVTVVETKIKVQKSPVDWDDLRAGMPFALDSSGTVLYTKTGKERAVCLNTMTTVPVGGASVYRVFL